MKKSWSFLVGYSPLTAIFKNWVDKFVRTYLREFFRSLAWSVLRPTQSCCPCLLAVSGSRRVAPGLSAMLCSLSQSVVTGTWHCWYWPSGSRPWEGCLWPKVHDRIMLGLQKCGIAGPGDWAQTWWSGRPNRKWACNSETPSVPCSKTPLVYENSLSLLTAVDTQIKYLWKYNSKWENKVF